AGGGDPRGRSGAGEGAAHGVLNDPLAARRCRWAAAAPQESAIARERLRVAVTDVADEAAAAGPRREVFGASPVDLVVARAKAWSRPVRDLVVLEASRAGRVTQATVLRDRRLLGGNLGRARRAPQASGIERATVHRPVIGLPVEHAGDAAAPATDVEAGQPVHQVDADVPEAGLASRHEGGARAASVV